MNNHAEEVREFYRNQGRMEAQENYTRGFRAGQKHERDAMLEYLNAHLDEGHNITIDEMIEEIQHWDKQDNDYHVSEITNGRVAQFSGMGKG